MEECTFDYGSVLFDYGSVPWSVPGPRTVPGSPRPLLFDASILCVAVVKWHVTMYFFVNEIVNYLIKFILFFDCFFCNRLSLMQRRVFTKETGHIGLLKCVAGDETLEKRNCDGFGALNSTNADLKFEYYSLRWNLLNNVITTLYNDIFIEIFQFQQSFFSCYHVRSWWHLTKTLRRVPGLYPVTWDCTRCHQGQSLV